MRTICLTIILFITFSSFAQTKPEASLIDEFGNPNCEILSARLDNFDLQLRNNPESEGIVFIIGERNNIRKNVIYESMVSNRLKSRGFDTGRLKIIRGGLSANLRFQFWIVPPGAAQPALPNEVWSFFVAANTKPSMFTWENDYDDICPPADGVRLFAEVLKANPKARGNIVFREVSMRRLARKKRYILEELTLKFKISRQRLRLFDVIDPPTGIKPPVEYWLVP